MGNTIFSDVVLWIAALSTGLVALYFGAVISGTYKDPLMARFRRYGEERRPCPVISFLNAFGVWCVLMAILMQAITQSVVLMRGTLVPLIFVVLAVMAFSGSLTVWHSETLRASLPRWYFELLETASREERRLIAYAWLRIPRKMRWRLNGDQAAFHVWADMVRITVIYGARDPDDPWVQWS